ncbi:MAG: hypothetical protein KatS3mg059_0695 [Thermomicrobiales bacterium]|nr:MAG: hypothetical protein KatS3mg059_0695 [Thermomicrobiales bacterium]
MAGNAGESVAWPPLRPGKPWLFWLNLGIKLTLIGLLMFAVARQDLPQFHGKAMTGRALTYPLSMIIVPVAWWLMRGARSSAYPFALDILLVLPFLIDTGGNALNLNDTISWWDDFNHFLNWAILAAASGQFLVRLPVGRLAAAGLMIGFGATTAIVWEIAEYITFVRNSPELATAYTDTLGDLGLVLTGSVLAAGVTWLAWPVFRPHSPPSPEPSLLSARG